MLAAAPDGDSICLTASQQALAVRRELQVDLVGRTGELADKGKLNVG